MSFVFREIRRHKLGAEKRDMTGNSGKTDKRSRLIDTASKLTYERGFAKMALADIARDAVVPLGNIYYYFKTKAEIGEAFIARRIAEVREMRRQCERSAQARDRLLAFVQIVADNREALARSGCPVGSLCAELHKEAGDLAAQSGEPFRELLNWFEAQFAGIGREREKTAFALHLLSALQGVALLANTFHDPELVVTEVEQLRGWIGGL
jgi:TetR/AcrR family transcriptional regulator, transcriptional repressor for nem operon